MQLRRSLEPFSFEVLTGIPERRKSLLQEVAQHWHAKKIAGRAFIVSAGRFVADLCPIACGIVVPTEPCQGHEVYLLIFRQGIDKRGDLLDDRIVFPVFEDRSLLVV